MALRIGYAEPEDVPALQAMAIELLPDLTALHGPDWTARLGNGRVWVESLLVVVRDSDAGDTPVGFAWGSAAMFEDSGVLEPWWCLNAVARQPAYRGRKIGERLVDVVREHARKAGVVSLYGICGRSLTPWYENQGFTVLAPGQKIESDGAARRFGNDEGTVFFGDEEGECMFYADIDGCSLVV